MFGVISTNSALIGLIGTLITALISLAGIYYKAHPDRSTNKEQRYEDGLWKTINMLTGRVENLDKRIADQDEVIDTLRKSNWDIRDKLSVAEASVRDLREDLDRANNDLKRTQESLEHAEQQLAETRNELQSALTSLHGAQEQVTELRQRERELQIEADGLRKRLAVLEAMQHNDSAGDAG